MIFNEIKCHVNTSFGLAGGMHPQNPPLCLRLLPVTMTSTCCVFCGKLFVVSLKCHVFRKSSYE